MRRGGRHPLPLFLLGRRRSQGPWDHWDHFGKGVYIWLSKAFPEPCDVPGDVDFVERIVAEYPPSQPPTTAPPRPATTTTTPSPPAPSGPLPCSVLAQLTPVHPPSVDATGGWAGQGAMADPGEHADHGGHHEHDGHDHGYGGGAGEAAIAQPSQRDPGNNGSGPTALPLLLAALALASLGLA